MEYEDIGRVLDEKQKYVVRAREDLGINVQATRHDIASSTCFEKADLLGWPAERVVKAVYFHRNSEMYGFVFPELGDREPLRIKVREVLPRVLGVTCRQAKKFRNSICPEGMEFGTCTPFVYEDSFEKGLREIFVHDLRILESKVVDISIGGTGEEAHKVSVHLPYSGIYDILKYRFGSRIQRKDLFA